MRNTGIPIIGNAPWGAHFCQFYQSRQDLADILVPYFKAGLEQNEFCMWITSPDLTTEEAEGALRQAAPEFERCRQKGQIEILPHTEWYLKGGTFELQHMLNGWVEKMEQALARGFEGLRLTGNTAWLEKKDWKGFAEYEQAVNEVIARYRIMALCTYSLDKCGPFEILDVVRNHQFALIGSEHGWQMVESSDRKRAEQALRESEERRKIAEAVQAERRRLYEVLEALPVCVCLLKPDYDVVFANRRFREFFGESHGRRCYDHLFGRREPCAFCESHKVLETHAPHHWECVDPGGRIIEVHDYPFTDADGSPLILEMDIDITERRQAEKAMQEANEALERRVAERTAELRANNEELTRFNRAAVGRELRMTELKKEINELCTRLAQPARYAVDLENETKPDVQR